MAFTSSVWILNATEWRIHHIVQNRLWHKVKLEPIWSINFEMTLFLTCNIKLGKAGLVQNLDKTLAQSYKFFTLLFRRLTSFDWLIKALTRAPKSFFKIEPSFKLTTGFLAYYNNNREHLHICNNYYLSFYLILQY